MHGAGVRCHSEDVPQAGVEASEINTDCVFQDHRAGLTPRTQVLTDQDFLFSKWCILNSSVG